MNAYALPEQRRINSESRILFRARAFLLPLIAVTALLLVANPRLEHHRGEFGPGFNQDVDVDTWRLKVRGNFELRAGGGTLNLVNERLGIGEVLWQW